MPLPADGTLPPSGSGGRILVVQGARTGQLVERAIPSLRIVLEGEERYELDGRTHRLREGQMMLMPAGTPVRVSAGPRARTRSVAIDVQAGLAQLESQAPTTPLMLPLVAHPVGAWLAQVAARLAQVETAGGATAAAALRDIAGAVASLAADGNLRMSKLDATRERTRSELVSRVEVARTFIEANLHRSVSCTELAEQTLISPFHLARAFRKVTGLAPAAYHRERRMDAARRMLLEGKRPGEVAASLGFADRSGFNRSFVRHFGHPPGQVGR